MTAEEKLEKIRQMLEDHKFLVNNLSFDIARKVLEIIKEGEK